MPAVSRKGDSLSTGHGCVSTTTLNTPGQSTVFANSILVARIGDPTVPHPNPPNPPKLFAIIYLALPEYVPSKLSCCITILY